MDVTWTGDAVKHGRFWNRKMKSTDPNYLKVVAKTFRIVEEMMRDSSGISLSELSRRNGQPKSTVFRILYTLKKLDWVQQDPGSEAYRLTNKIRGVDRDESMKTLKRLARPWMQRLLATFEQTVNLAVLDDGKLLYIEMLEGLRSIRMAATVNSYVPVYSTALGKAILAFLPPQDADRILRATRRKKWTDRTITSIRGIVGDCKKAREQGYALDDQESEVGARCVGAPIFNAEGRPIAAISISAPDSLLPDKEVPTVGKAVMGACEEISALLGYQHHPG